MTFLGKNDSKEIIDCESLLQGLVSEQGLLANTGAKYGASIYSFYTYSY